MDVARSKPSDDGSSLEIDHTQKEEHMNTKILFGSLAILIVAAAALPYPVQADTVRITRGDVDSVLHAFTTGGRTVLSLQSDTAGFHAAPADFHGSNGAIRPFSPWDGLHVCVNDWHVLLIGLFDGGGKSYTMQDAQSYLSQVDALFLLDGNPVRTTRTSIKRFLNPASIGLQEAYGFQEGSIMAPGDLGVGAHSLQVHVVDPVYGDAQLNITFSVDDGTSPACN
jgi:hypothetical protein